MEHGGARGSWRGTWSLHEERHIGGQEERTWQNIEDVEKAMEGMWS